jgi:transcriptional regulator of arginine metabolism
VKLERHAAILRVIRERRIRNQDELRTALVPLGIRATQATLSRDIHELGLVKVSDAEGVFYGTGTEAGALRPDLGQLVRALLVSADGVGPLLVLRTAAGSAGALTAAIDGAGWSEVIGTIAGDDTVLVVTRGPREREAVAERLRRSG